MFILYTYILLVICFDSFHREVMRQARVSHLLVRVDDNSVHPITKLGDQMKGLPLFKRYG